MQTPSQAAVHRVRENLIAARDIYGLSLYAAASVDIHPEDS